MIIFDFPTSITIASKVVCFFALQFSLGLLLYAVSFKYWYITRYSWFWSSILLAFYRDFCNWVLIGIQMKWAFCCLLSLQSHWLELLELWLTVFISRVMYVKQCHLHFCFSNANKSYANWSKGHYTILIWFLNHVINICCFENYLLWFPAYRNFSLKFPLDFFVFNA